MPYMVCTVLDSEVGNRVHQWDDRMRTAKTVFGGRRGLTLWRCTVLCSACGWVNCGKWTVDVLTDRGHHDSVGPDVYSTCTGGYTRSG